MFRKSRCLTLILMVIIFHIVVLSLLSSRSDIQNKFQVNFLDLKKFLTFQSPKDFTNFNKLIDARFEERFSERSSSDANKLYLLELGNDVYQNEIVLPEYLVDPDNFENPHLQKFDPRFTIGLLFDHLSRSFRSLSLLDELEIPYFHWADWTDLSYLDEHFLSNEKKTCKEMFDQTVPNKYRNRKLELMDTQDFCIDDEDIDVILANKDADPDFKKKLQHVQAQPYSPRWHVFTYGGRSKKSLKVLHSKSYLNDFMPPPLAINFLLPTDDGQTNNGMVVKVNQDLQNKKKIMDTNLADAYIRTYRNQNKEALDVSRDIVLNVKDQINGISKKFQEKQLDLQSVNKLSPPKPLEYERHLSHDMFVDNTSAILESMKKISDDKLTLMEKLYRQSLAGSLDTTWPAKYFYEAKIIKKESNFALGGHYDWRYFSGIINYTDRHFPALYGLLKAWLSFTNTYGLNSWVAHGSMLGWYWDGLSFPWDNDIDVQMPIQDLHKLAKFHNQSLVVDLNSGDGEETRFGRYFIDVGSSISYRVKGNGNNNIDARFVDVDSGLYIDITGLAVSEAKTPVRFNQLLPKELDRSSPDATITDFHRNNWLKAYNCRNHHFARLEELSPLKLSMVEGVPGYIPNNFRQLLLNEYHDKGVNGEHFKGYTYLPKLRLWVKTANLNKFVQNRDIKLEDDELPAFSLQDEDYIDLLFEQEELLVEYLLTRNITELHEQEMTKLLVGESTEKLLFNKGSLKVQFPPLRHDYFTYDSHASNYNFQSGITEKLNQIKLANAAKLEAEVESKNIENKPIEIENTREEVQPEPAINPPAANGMPSLKQQTSKDSQDPNVNRKPNDI